MQRDPFKVVVPVAYHMPGDVIKQMLIKFKMFQMENHFIAVPHCKHEVKRIVNIPETINFEIVKGFLKKADFYAVKPFELSHLSNASKIRIKVKPDQSHQLLRHYFINNTGSSLLPLGYRMTFLRCKPAIC